MLLKKTAMAGTLESSDAQVLIEPGGEGIALSIKSNVLNQYGKQIRAAVLETLNHLRVENARVTVVDKGALDCTLRARVECAIYRAAEHESAVPWGGDAP